MNKLNLLALAATPVLTPGTVLAVSQNLDAQGIFKNIPEKQKFDQKTFEKQLFDRIDFEIDKTGISSTIKEKFEKFFRKFTININDDPSILENLFDKFKSKEPEAFKKDPTSSFINYFLDKLMDKIKNSDLVKDSHDSGKIIREFITDIKDDSFLNDFGNNGGKAQFIQETDDKLKALATRYHIKLSSLSDLNTRIISQYPQILKDLIKDKAYKNPNEPYIKQVDFDNAVIKTIDEEIANEDTAPLLAAKVQKTIEDEFSALLQDTNNIDNDFSKKTIDYLKYYLIDKDSPIVSHASEDDYFFAKLFGDYKNKTNVKKFWDDWFGDSKDSNIDVNIRYANFSDDNNKGKIELTFNVKVNGINAIDPIEKQYEVDYKSNDNWDKDIIKTEIENIFKNIPKIIEEWINDGYKISEDLSNPTKNFWDVLKTKGFDLESEIKRNTKLNGKINIGDFEVNVLKLDDRWIFKISIDKTFRPAEDPVAKEYNHLTMDQISEVEFQTIIYDIKQNLLELPTHITDLKRSEIYSGIYQDDLKDLLKDYPGGLIPLKELENNGKLWELFKSRYTKSEIDTFIKHIKDLSLNNDKYSMDNSAGGIGKIGYKYIPSPSWDKSGYFELFIENEKGVVQSPISIKDDNLKIYKYKDPYDHFKVLLEKAKIDKANALKPGQKLNIPNKWLKLMQIIPALDSGTSPQDSGLYLRTFARIYDLVNNDLVNNFKIEYEDNITKVIFTLNNGQEYEKIISLDALTQSEKDDFKNKTNNRLDQIKGYIDKIQDQDLKTKIEDIYQNKRDNIDNLLDNLQTKDDAQEISDKVIELVDEITKAVSQDEKEILFNELQKRYPKGIPEEVEEKIKKWINDKENDLLNKSEREIENILDSGKDLYEDLRNINIDTLLNINKTLTNFEKYGIIALGGVLAVDSVAAGAVAYGISRKNKKLVNTNKTKMKRAKSLVIFNLAISLLTAGGSVAMFILIFIIKGGL